MSQSDNIREWCLELIWVNAELHSAQIEMFNRLTIENSNCNEILRFINEFTNISKKLTLLIKKETNMNDTELSKLLKTYCIRD
jgi:hypothetical protein